MRVQPDKPTESRINWLAPATILLLAILAYIPAMRAGFIWDDTLLIGDNAAIKSPTGLHTIWITKLMADNWPVTATSFWLEWRLWGMNASGYHVVNIILHGLNAVLLWRVLRRLSVSGAWAAGLLFAVHPVCAASVAWISERKNTLSLFFVLISLLCYLRSDRDSRGLKWYLLSIAAFTLSLLSKSSVGGFPLVMLLCAWWQNRGITRRDILRSVPFFGLSLAMGVLTIWSQYRGMNSSGVSGGDGMAVRLLGGSWALWFYLGKILWPVNLTMIYPRWEINPGALVSWLPGLLFIGLLGVCWRYRNSWGRAALFALGYFVIALAPVLGFIGMAYFAISRVSDHLQYLAMPGILALLVAGGSQLLAKFGQRLQTAAAAGVVMLLAVLTWERTWTFLSPEMLWADNIKKNPGAWRVHNSLGAEFFRAGKNEAAVREYREAVRLAPDAGDAHYNLGNALYRLGHDHLEEAIAEFLTAARDGSEIYHAENNAGIALTELGRWEEATTHYKKAVAARESFADAHRNLGVAYLHLKREDAAKAEFEAALQYDPANAAAQEGLGAIMENEGDVASAVAHLQSAVQTDPGNPSAHHNLALALAKQGNLTGAEEEFKKAVSLKSDESSTHADLADTLVRQGRLDDAKMEFAESLKLNPINATVHNSFGTLLDRKGDLDGAMAQFQEAIRLDHASATAHKNLGLMLARKQRLNEAIREFQESLRLRPNDADTESELGNVFGRNDRPDDAMIHFQAAVKLDPNNAGAENGLGVVMDIKGRVDEALNHFQAAVRLKPDLVRAHINLANTLLKKRRREEAIAEYQAALKLQPTNAEAQKQLQLLTAPH